MAGNPMRQASVSLEESQFAAAIGEHVECIGDAECSSDGLDGTVFFTEYLQFAVENIDEIEFLGRANAALSSRVWLLDRAVTRPFRLVLSCPQNLSAESLDSLLLDASELRVDVTGLVEPTDVVGPSVVFLALYPSGAVRGFSAVVTREDRLWLSVNDPSAMFDPEAELESTMGHQDHCKVDLIGIQAPAM